MAFPLKTREVGERTKIVIGVVNYIETIIDIVTRTTIVEIIVVGLTSGGNQVV